MLVAADLNDDCKTSDGVVGVVTLVRGDPNFEHQQQHKNLIGHTAAMQFFWRRKGRKGYAENAKDLPGKDLCVTLRHLCVLCELIFVPLDASPRI